MKIKKKTILTWKKSGRNRILFANDISLGIVISDFEFWIRQAWYATLN